MGYPGVSPVESQLASVVEAIRNCLQPYHLKSLSDMFVGVGGWTKEKREFRELKAGKKVDNAQFPSW